MSSAPGWFLIEEDVEDLVSSMGSTMHRLAGKTVLVTGAQGFLAGYLVDAIAWSNQHRVLSPPAQLKLLVRSPRYKGGRLSHLVGRADVEFIVQDVCQPLDLEGPIDFIIHAASPASPKWYRRDPLGTIDANSLALRGLLDLARRRETESVLYFSSSEVYGTPEAENIPTPETYVGRVDFLNERACYAEAKQFGETLCRTFFEQHGVPVKMVRPFHIHGPGQRLDDGRIVAELISQGLDGRQMELLSDGLATRTYGYVSDATIGFLEVLLSDFNGEAFNVGADSPEVSISQLATLVAGLFKDSRPVLLNRAQKPSYLQGAPSRACPDLTKIQTLLDVQPRVPFEVGLERTIRWLRTQVDQEN